MTLSKKGMPGSVRIYVHLYQRVLGKQITDHKIAKIEHVKKPVALSECGKLDILLT